MGIFGEKYSKESFLEKSKEAEKLAEARYPLGEASRTAEGSVEARDHEGRISMVRLFNDLATKLEDRLNLAWKEKEALLGSAQGEAQGLRKEHDRLINKAKEALKSLEDFEREKLDMHQEEKEGAEEGLSEQEKE